MGVGLLTIHAARHPVGATFDSSRRYRYRLWRDWRASRHRVTFIMLNPSTADETTLDPTIRRCIGFARTWGFDGLDVVNLFAWRSTDPAALARVDDPVGAQNDTAIAAVLRASSLTVAAWGGDPFARERALLVSQLARRLGRPLFCLGITKTGAPRHPLYLSRDAPLRRAGGLPCAW